MLELDVVVPVDDMLLVLALELPLLTDVLVDEDEDVELDSDELVLDEDRFITLWLNVLVVLLDVDVDEILLLEDWRLVKE